MITNTEYLRFSTSHYHLQPPAWSLEAHYASGTLAPPRFSREVPVELFPLLKKDVHEKRYSE